MKIDLAEEPMTALAEYARISIAFRVDRVMDVTGLADGPGGFTLSERPIDVPYVKDYDAIEGEGPASWAARFDVSNWALLAARESGRCVGGAVVAFNTPKLAMLEGRRDLAVLWDIRVAPEARGHGIGSALVRMAEARARARGCSQLKVETQNVNVRACRLYARHGCRLRSIDASAYPGFPGEIQLVWYKDL